MSKLANLKDITSTYASAIQSLSAGETIELEIRFSEVTKEIFESLYSHILSSKMFKTPVIETGINIISNDIDTFESKKGKKNENTSYIRNISYKDDISKDSYYKKVKLTRPQYMTDYIRYAIVVSKESPINKFPTSKNALIRFKTRLSSVYLKYNGSWRFDLTAIKKVMLNDMNTGNLKNIKNSLFKNKLTPETFLTNLNTDIIDSYEIELEYIGTGVIDFAVANDIFTMVNPQYLTEIAYQEEIYNIATHIITNKFIIPNFKNADHKIKRLLNQAKSLTKFVYYNDIYPPTDYLLTIKADGERAVLIINGNRCRILSTTLFEYMQGEFVSGDITILDCELITEKNIVRIFDVMVIENEPVMRYGMMMRIEHIPRAAELVNSIIGYTKLKAVAAVYKILSDDKLEADIKSIVDAKYNFDTDGMILSEPLKSYEDTNNFKWKPYDKNTIDFVAVKCPQKLLGIIPYEVKKDYDLYILFVGISHKIREYLGLNFIQHYKQMFGNIEGEYYPIQFSPSANPLAHIYYHPSGENINMKIVELCRNEDNTTWIFNKLRLDREIQKTYYGNDFKTAELTYMNYIDRFPLSDLWKRSESYFTQSINTIHGPPNKYKRFVISNIFKNNLAGKKWVIDEAAGRGADLHRYKEIGVESVLFIDIDPTAITELISRKFSYFAINQNVSNNKIDISVANRQNNYRQKYIPDPRKLTVHTLVADMKTHHSDLSSNVFQYGLNVGMVDGIVCNFALHYMCDTVENLRNILLFNVKMLKIGGVFIFTVMDGLTIFNMLNTLAFGQTWESHQDGVLKYAIRKDYRGDKITPTGQNIAVLLPFVDEMQPEPLCNVDVVIAEATRLGMSVELNESMDNMMTNFASSNKKLFEQLTDEDKKYISIFRYVSLRKVKEVK